MPWSYEQRPRLYRIWHLLRSRCRNPKFPRYPDYGGRGIQAQFSGYPEFRDWALKNGYRDGLTIERKNNDGDYSPENCIWIPRAAQAANKRNNKRIQIFNETKHEAEWARDPRCVVSHGTFRQRLHKGWNPESALTEPVKTWWSRHEKHV